MKRVLLLLTLLITPMLIGTASAQDASAAATAPAADPNLAIANQLIWMLYILAAVVVMLVFATLVMIDYFFRTQFQRSIFPTVNIPMLRWSWWAGTKPATSNARFDQDLGHDYDGITELDNPAPPLFNYILYGTAIFAVIYLLNYHVFGWSESQEEEYIASSNELDTLRARAASLAANKVDENTITWSTDPTVLSAGKAIFLRSCAVCHGNDGEGKIGPNLTDDYWVHGNSIQAVFKTVKYGVPAKGMIAWQSQLTPAQMAEVSSYILTLHGTKPANPKAPEGEKLGAPAQAAPVADTTQANAMSVAGALR